MGRLVCAGLVSLDGYVADAAGNFDWAAPDPEVHAFVNDLESNIGTYLYGRRMYEVMRFWESAGPELPDVERAYAEIWRSTDKVVFSRTLDEVTTARTRLVRSFDPMRIREIVRASPRDVSVGGPHLAAAAFRAGIVEEVHTFLTPVAVGGGNRFLPDGVRVDLELVGVDRFAGGTVHLHHRVRR
jgi:dihydrofolate reductase